MKVVKRLKIAISGDCSPLGRLCEMWLLGARFRKISRNLVRRPSHEIESPTFHKTSTFQKASTFQKHPLHKLKKGDIRYIS